MPAGRLPGWFSKIREIEAVVRAADQPRHSSHRRSGRSAPTLNTENHTERGRPSDYSADIAMRICERLVAGERLGTICADAGMPAKATVYGWLTRNQEFRRLYALARDLADEILEIADDSTDDWIEYRGKDGKTRRVFNMSIGVFFGYRPSFSAIISSTLKMVVELANAVSALYAMASNGLCR
jgi:hypothetical protein